MVGSVLVQRMREEHDFDLIDPVFFSTSQAGAKAPDGGKPGRTVKSAKDLRELAAMDVGPAGRIATLLYDARFSLLTALLAGFGRAAAEVGAVIIVGGNIAGYTRTMTTAIALETSKGDLPLALGLGIVLITIILCINAVAWGARRIGELRAG